MQLITEEGYPKSRVSDDAALIPTMFRPCLFSFAIVFLLSATHCVVYTIIIPRNAWFVNRLFEKKCKQNVNKQKVGSGIFAKI
jgi:hypothetical protein